MERNWQNYPPTWVAQEGRTALPSRMQETFTWDSSAEKYRNSSNDCAWWIVMWGRLAARLAAYQFTGRRLLHSSTAPAPERMSHHSPTPVPRSIPGVGLFARRSSRTAFNP